MPALSEETETAATVAKFAAILAVILRLELALVPPAEAEIVAVRDEFVKLVLTVKVTLDDPAGTITEAGIVATLLLLPRETTVPLPIAGPVKVTVAVLLSPATTEVGLRVSDATGTAGGVTVNDAV